MRIAIDARAAAEVPAGRGRYVRELLRGMAALSDDHEYVLLARTPWDGQLDERFRWQVVGAGEPQWAFAAAWAARGCDRMMATNSYLLAALAPCPAMTTVYDFVAFDPSLQAPRGSKAERVTLPLALRRAKALVCISQATLDTLMERFPSTPAARAHAVPLGVQPHFFDGPGGVSAAREALGLTRPYLLMTGTLEPRKNITRAIEAVAGLPADLREGVDLVLAGPRGWQTAEIDAALQRHSASVTALGHVPEEHLAGLYAGAEVFLYPSLEEGFGLPVLEAMAAGAPVVTSDRSSLPEVGGDAVAYVDPYDVDSIRAAVAALLADEPALRRLAAAGPERARGFTWARTARETLDLTVAAGQTATAAGRSAARSRG